MVLIVVLWSLDLTIEAQSDSFKNIYIDLP